MAIFKSKQKRFGSELKINLSGNLYSTKSVKYLGIKIVTNLTW